jgi:hypothetical protein
VSRLFVTICFYFICRFVKPRPPADVDYSAEFYCVMLVEVMGSSHLYIQTWVRHRTWIYTIRHAIVGLNIRKASGNLVITLLLHRCRLVCCYSQAASQVKQNILALRQPQHADVCRTSRLSGSACRHKC